MKKIGFFEEDQGVRSHMRLQSFIALMAGVGISIFAVVTKQLDVNLIALVTMFVVAAFAPKAVQKFAEIKK